ncbi:MAG: xanthine dehydrogenase family protein subunit M [Deltaproteobacteria bacterium]|nr:xanthine dehydrogenase family protein subunit M [Deltaproteobacteria bacterium]
MQPFTYVRARTVDEAVAAAGSDTRFVAGGTTLVDLMRLEVMTPRTIVDISGLPLDAIEEGPTGLRVGALARNSAVARDPRVRARYPVLAQALESGASPQLRNMATVGGNLLQRTRCSYFRDGVSACNKRAPGTGCAAFDGYHRMHAVLGGSEHCIAAHPSDMAVALLALDAIVHVRGPLATRTVPIADLFLLPKDTPHVEHTIGANELIVHVDLPATPFAAHSRYVKVRDRSEFAFALASAAVAFELRSGRVGEARIALGGVGTRPWRAREAEAVLAGQPPSPELVKKASAAALEGARPRKDNAFKVELARRTVARAFEELLVAQDAKDGGGAR